MNHRLRHVINLGILSVFVSVGLTLCGCLEDADGSRGAGGNATAEPEIYPKKKNTKKNNETTTTWRPQKLSDLQNLKSMPKAHADDDLDPEVYKEKVKNKIKVDMEQAEKIQKNDRKRSAKLDLAGQTKSPKNQTDSGPTLGVNSGKSVYVVPPRANVREKDKKNSNPHIYKVDPKSRYSEASIITNPDGKSAVSPEISGVTATSRGEQKKLPLAPSQKSESGFLKKISNLFSGKTSKPQAAPFVVNGLTIPTQPQTYESDTPSDTTPKRSTTVLEMTKTELARERLEGAVKDQTDAPELSSNEQKSETIALPQRPTPPTAAHSPTSLPTPLPSTDEVDAFHEQYYRESLASRDIVARDAAFKHAAHFRREDAIPFLIAEIDHDNSLATLAAQCLASIGKNTPEVESALIAALKNASGAVRRRAADALGSLRSHRAAAPLIEALKTEKHFEARAAYCNALGLTSERAALPVLKKKLDEAGEIEYVKASAALALAVLDDPTGRAYLIHLLDSPTPALQIIGLHGLAQLKDSDVVGHLSAALESRFTEVWTTATYLFPRIGPAVSLPILRMRLRTPNEVVRRRVGLALGWLGSEDGLVYIEKAVQEGDGQERIMGCELLGRLGRRSHIPLLITKLQDSSSSVRQTAAVALTRLEATEAIPAMIEATRGTKSNQTLPIALRGAGTDTNERVMLLSCIRILRGEKEDLVISTFPNQKEGSWPEVDRVIAQQQTELVKLYQLVDVVVSDQVSGAIIKDPHGKEILLREGEILTAGYRVRDIGLSQIGANKEKLPAYVTLMRGAETVRLIEGGSAEVETKRRPK
jgi:HEAT repeat protein